MLFVKWRQIVTGWNEKLGNNSSLGFLISFYSDFFSVPSLNKANKWEKSIRITFVPCLWQSKLRLSPSPSWLFRPNEHRTINEKGTFI